MTPEEWSRLQALFEAVMDAPPEERESALRKAEAGLENEALRAELRRLVEHAEPEPGFLQPVFRLPEPIQPGSLVGGRFRVLRELGRGGMGQVFEAEDEQLGERVAIKAIQLAGALESRKLERLKREVQLARKVSHPNVCRVHDVGEHGGNFFLSMELVEGETLAQRLERGPLPLDEWESVARQIMDGLQAAHEAGVVHRDLKPSNIMLAGSRVVILDFGLARGAVGETGGSLTQTGTVIGTLDWMAPEQLRGEWDHRSDLYSAALVLLYALTGSRPEIAGDGLAGALRRATGKIEFANLLPVRLSASKRYFLLRSLELNPARRFRSAAEARKYLGRKPAVLPRLRAMGTKAGLGLALAAVACVSLFIGGLRYWRYPSFKEGSTIVIASTVNATGDSQFNGIAPLLRASVAQSARVNVWDQKRLPGVLRAMRRNADAEPAPAAWREIALREGAPLLVFSTVSPSGTGYTLTVRCEQTGKIPDAPLRAWDRTIHASGPAGLFEAVREAGVWVRNTAGEETGEIAAYNRLPQDITSASWEALALFGRAESLYASERLAEAVPLLKRALQLDPEFTMAIMRLGDILTSLNQGQEGLEYWRQAVSGSHLQRLSEHERLNIESRYAFEIGDLAAAEPPAREMALKFPNDHAGALLFAATLMGLGRTAEGLEVAKGGQARFGPSLMGSSMILRGLADHGQYAEMDAQFKAVESLSPIWTRWFKSIAAASQQQYSHAGGHLAELAKAGSMEASRAATLIAALEADQGNVAGAIAVIRPAIVRDRENGAEGFAARKSVVLGFLEAQSGAKERARALAWEALSGTPSLQVVTEAVTVLARSGYTADAERAARKAPEGRGPVYAAAQLRMQGEILAARRNYASAVETMERAAQSKGNRHSKEYLARVLHLAGQEERAALLYGEIAGRPWSIWSSPETEWPGTIFEAREYLKSRRGDRQ